MGLNTQPLQNPGVLLIYVSATELRVYYCKQDWFFVGRPRKGTRYLMVKTMETKTAAIYLRKSTEDDGKSVG